MICQFGKEMESRPDIPNENEVAQQAKGGPVQRGADNQGSKCKHPDNCICRSDHACQGRKEDALTKSRPAAMGEHG